MLLIMNINQMLNRVIPGLESFSAMRADAFFRLQCRRCAPEFLMSLHVAYLGEVSSAYAAVDILRHRAILLALFASFALASLDKTQIAQFERMIINIVDHVLLFRAIGVKFKGQGEVLLLVFSVHQVC